MSGTHNFELCGDRGYAALSIYFTPVQIEDNPGMPDLIAQGNAIVKAAEAAGRDPVAARNDWRICREVYVADSKNAAMEEIRESLKQSYDYLFKIGLAPLMKRDASMADAEVTFDWMVENVPWIIGSPEDVIAQVRELDEAVGGFGSLLFNSREWVTIDRWNRSLELFARYVSPHFRARDDQRFRAELAADALGDYAPDYQSARVSPGIAAVVTPQCTPCVVAGSERKLAASSRQAATFFDARCRRAGEVLDLEPHREQAVVVGVDVVGDRRAGVERLGELDHVVAPDRDVRAARAQQIVLALVQQRAADDVDVEVAGAVEVARRQREVRRLADVQRVRVVPPRWLERRVQARIVGDQRVRHHELELGDGAVRDG